MIREMQRPDRLNVEYDRIETMGATFQPGDGTRYQIVMIQRHDLPNVVYVAGSPSIGMVALLKSAVLDCYRRNREYVGESLENQEPALDDWFIDFIMTNAQCGRWEAWAVVQCVQEAIGGIE